MKRTVLFDVSGSMMGKAFDSAWAGLIETYQQHYRDDIRVIAFSDRCSPVFSLSDLVFGRIGHAGSSSELRKAVEWITPTLGPSDVLTVITDPYPNGWPSQWPCQVELRIVSYQECELPEDLIQSLAHKGGSICLQN